MNASYDFLDKKNPVETTNTQLNMIALFSNDFEGYFRSGLMTGDITKKLYIREKSWVFLEGQWDVFLKTTYMSW